MRQSTELTLSVPWGHVSAVSWGSPKNRPVLVVHGNQDNAGAFTRLIQLLPDTYHYVAIDLPGHGLSSHFPPGMFLDFFNFVLAIHYVLDALNWEKCLYLGHSFGGQIGVMYCIFYPGRIEKMITIDALMAEGFTPPDAFERLKIIHKSTLLAFEKKDERLYTGEQVLDALMNRRRFKLTREAAEALMVRAVTRVGDKYKYNRDIRMKIHVGLCFSDEQNFEFFKHLRTPVLFLLAKDSWFGLVKKLHLAEKYKELFTEFLTMVTIEGNHDVHNNIPENVAPHVIAWFDDGAKSKL